MSVAQRAQSVELTKSTRSTGAPGPTVSDPWGAYVAAVGDMP